MTASGITLLPNRRGAYRERSHRKGINIACFRGQVNVITEAFWGHISGRSWLEPKPVAPEIGKCTRNSKVCEARVAISSNKNVALEVSSINVQADIQTVSCHPPERCSRVRCLAREDMRGHRRPPQAVACGQRCTPVNFDGCIPTLADWRSHSLGCTVQCFHLASMDS